MIKKPSAIIALLTAINLFNFIDRYVISVVSPKMQLALGFSDGQIGTIGSAFLLGYLVSNPIFGLLGDRFPRKLLIASGVLVWSIATAGTGFFATFLSILMMRILVGIGEASYMANSPTIIDDLSTPSNRSRLLGVFYAAIPVGSALGFILGSTLEAKFGWRKAFFIAGGPGAIFAILCLLIQEPTHASKSKSEKHLPFIDILKSYSRSPPYVWASVGYIGQTFALGAFAFWAPTFMEREFPKYYIKGQSSFDPNIILGLIIALSGFLGTMLGGIWADKAKGRNRIHAAMRVSLMTTCLAIVPAFVSIYSPNIFLFFLCLALVVTGVFTSAAPISTVFMGTVPGNTRAFALSLATFSSHLLGDMLSIKWVGSLSTRFHSLRVAMLILPAALILNAIAWYITMKFAENIDGSSQSLPNAL